MEAANQFIPDRVIECLSGPFVTNGIYEDLPPTRCCL